MRTIRTHSATYRITEKEYKQLLARFNPDNIDEDGYIEKPCICPGGRWNCDICHLGGKQVQFPVPCLVLLEELNLSHENLGMSMRGVEVLDDELGLQELKAIYDGLLSLRRD